MVMMQMMSVTVMLMSAISIIVMIFTSLLCAGGAHGQPHAI